MNLFSVQEWKHRTAFKTIVTLQSISWIKERHYLILSTCYLAPTYLTTLLHLVLIPFMGCTLTLCWLILIIDRIKTLLGGKLLGMSMREFLELGWSGKTLSKFGHYQMGSWITGWDSFLTSSLKLAAPVFLDIPWLWLYHSDLCLYPFSSVSVSKPLSSLRMPINGLTPTIILHHF